MNAPITIPVIDVAAGWTIDQVKTIANCDDAEAYLTGAVAEIEGQLQENKLNGYARGLDWTIRAKKALRYRKQALQMVARRRGEINKALRSEAGETNDRLLINLFKSEFPEQFQAAAAKVNAMRKGA